MPNNPQAMTGGCQCGAVRYALLATPQNAVCHCRMCQKATGGPFAAFAMVKLSDLRWTRGQPATFQSSSIAAREFCRDCGTPLTFRFLDGENVDVTIGSLDHPEAAAPKKHVGIEARLPWLDTLMAGHLPDQVTGVNWPAGRVVRSRQHPDHATPDGWAPPTA